jgi:hypothetical protein
MASLPKSQPADSAIDPVALGPNPTLRSILSLLIFIHFFCVFVVLSSTFRRSALQSRLVSIFGPYTQVLAFDPGFFTPYYYTQGQTSDDDAVIVADLYSEADRPIEQLEIMKTVTLPGGGSRWLADRRRAIALAQLMAGYADPEDERDELSGEIARGVGSRLMQENGAKRAALRCVRRLSQPLDLSTLFANFPPDNPEAAQYDEVLYEADVWIDEDGDVQVQRRVAQAEAAPRRASPAPNARATPREPTTPNRQQDPAPPAANSQGTTSSSTTP